MYRGFSSQDITTSIRRKTRARERRTRESVAERGVQLSRTGTLPRMHSIRFREAITRTVWSDILESRRLRWIYQGRDEKLMSPSRP